jgi:hypothetical protein
MMKLWKHLSLVLFVLSSSSLAFSEDWKGTPETSEISVGGLAGLGIIDNSSGFSVLGTVSKKIIHHGFVPDINNTVSLEGAIGPVFLSGVTAWLYSAHLRWDFEKDATWTFFGLGGVGGNILSTSTGNNSEKNSRFVMTPRFGVGAFYKLTQQVRLRADIAHDFMGVGVNLPF